MQKEIFPRKADKTSEYRRYAKRNIFLKKKTRLGVYYIFERMNNKIMRKEIFPRKEDKAGNIFLYKKER